MTPGFFETERLPARRTAFHGCLSLDAERAFSLLFVTEEDNCLVDFCCKCDTNEGSKRNNDELEKSGGINGGTHDDDSLLLSIESKD